MCWDNQQDVTIMGATLEESQNREGGRKCFGISEQKKIRFEGQTVRKVVAIVNTSDRF